MQPPQALARTVLPSLGGLGPRTTNPKQPGVFFIAQKDCGVEIRFSGIFRDGFHPKKGHLGEGGLCVGSFFGGETLHPGLSDCILVETRCVFEVTWNGLNGDRHSHLVHHGPENYSQPNLDLIAKNTSNEDNE